MTSSTGHNIGLAIVGHPYFVSTFVYQSALLLRMNISAKKPHHRQAVNRYAQIQNHNNI